MFYAKKEMIRQNPKMKKRRNFATKKQNKHKIFAAKYFLGKTDLFTWQNLKIVNGQII